MNGQLCGRAIVLGVTGGIAAYKACEVVSRLKKLGALVNVILTENAARFVPPLTFQSLSGRPVAECMFDQPAQWDMKHISWAKAADLFVVAPATANLIAKHACGIADDMLTSTLLATKAPILIAPAMNTKMWQHPATQANMETLKSRGALIVGPGSGRLACGDVDEGRMAEPAEIVEAICALLCPVRDFEGKRVLVTAGPTREAIDPVRYLSNHSSGKMGYAIAEAARLRGAEVTLISGPVALPAPQGVAVVGITTARELYDAMMSRAALQDVIIQAAAPADFRPEESPRKRKKTDGEDTLTLTLYKTDDVAAAVGEIKRPGQFIVAFAAETEDLLENAKAKLIRKNADLVVANDITQAGAGFSVDTNIVAFVTREGVTQWPMMTKRQVADEILNAAVREVK